MNKVSWKKLEKENLKGKIFLLPTDTVYGFHALVDDVSAIKNIVKIKKRKERKYFINLIAEISDLKKFDIKINENQKKFLEKIWPGKVTIIFTDVNGEKKSFRIPAHRKLRNFIKKIGPIISTSANRSGELPIFEPDKLSTALKNNVDFYIDEGSLKSKPSTILELIR